MYITLHELSFPCTLSFKLETKNHINAATRNKQSAVLYLLIPIMFLMSFELTDSTTFRTSLSPDIGKLVTLMCTGYMFML